MSEPRRERPAPHARAGYPYIRVMTTRWRDNDVYGHVNNTVYYEYFDSVVGGWLLENKLLDIETSPVIGLVVATNCAYFAPIVFPDTIAAGLRAARIGQSSVTYEIALFRNDATTAAAQGRFTHAMVDRATRRSTPVPGALRAALLEIRAPSA